MVNPEEIIKLLELAETRAGRVGLFVRGFYTHTDNPDDQIPLERIYEKWRSWRLRFKMSEAEFRGHLRANNFDVHEADEPAVLVGWASAPPRPAPRTARQLNITVLLRYAHLSGSIEALADNCGIPIQRLRLTLKRDRQLREVINKAIEQGKEKRREVRVALTPEQVVEAQTRWNGSMLSGRSPEYLSASAHKAGFRSHVDYVDAVRKKKAYKRALAANDPATDELYRQWREAEGKKISRHAQSNKIDSRFALR